MQCAYCGNTLAPGSAYCLVCGASAGEPTPGDAPEITRLDDEKAAPPENAPHSPGHSPRPLRARTAFYGRYGTRGAAALPQPSSLTLSPAPPDAESARSEASVLDTPRANASVTAAAIFGAGPATARASAAPETLAPSSDQIPIPFIPRRSLAGRLVALGGMLVLLGLLVSLSAFGYHAYKKNLSDTRAAAATTARLNTSATAAAQATATASAPLFLDSLTSNTSGWLANGATAFFADGQYHLRNPDPTMTLDSYYQQQTYDNFRVQVTVTAYSDANPNADVPYAYGLILRADPNTPADKYVFFVSPAGTYDFARHDDYSFYNNGWSDLSAIPWASSSAIHTGKGATNTLMVVAIDNSFTLFINGQQIEVVTDAFSGYLSGWIGLLVEGADMEAGFSNLQVYGPDA